MLISVGEILVDIFKDNKGETALPGGAPFNLAANATLYTKEVAFIGAVGNDENGKILIAASKRKNFKYTNIKVFDEYYTSKAIVTLIDGERGFKFDRSLGADYQLDINDIDFSSIKSGDIVHIGSLMLSYQKGRDFFNELVKRIREIKGVLISFDINFRTDIYSSKEEAIKISIDALKKADILKFSIDELYLLSGKNDVKSALEALVNKNQIVAISLGQDGSMLYVDGKIHHIESVIMKPVDTTGAGDAFYSYFLSSLINHPDFVNSDELIQKYMFRSNVVGAISTLKKGAIDVAPTESEIDSFIRSH